MGVGRQSISVFSLGFHSSYFLTRANAQWEIHVSLCTLTHTTELIIWSIICVLSACSTTFVCTLHIRIADFTTTIIPDFLPSGLVVQSVEQPTIKYEGLTFDYGRGRRIFFFFASCNLPPFLTRSNAQWEIRGFSFPFPY